MDYPFIKCLNPQRIHNAKGEEIVVPCRCCKACLMNKANKMSFQCSLEEQDNKYCIFVTLTYSNDNVPLCKPVSCEDKNGEHLGYILYNCCDRLKDLGETLGFDDVKRHHHAEYMRYFLNKVKLGGYIPYLSSLDFQRFMKRFRKHLNKYSDEKVRYYACGEYGPRTFRPHFHFLLFFNKKVTFENYAKCLRAAWPYGRIDSSASRSKCASYVARYVNSSVALPRLYEISTLKPFSSHSSFLGQGFYRSQKKKIYESEPEEFIRQCRSILGRNVGFMPWRSLTASFFPRCREFNGKSYSELLQSYTILQRAQQIYGKDCTVNYLAHAIYSDCSDNECTRYFAYAYDIEAKKKRLDFRKFKDFTKQTVPYPVITLEQTELTAYQRAITAITSELYISKHFLDYVCDNRTYFEIRKKIFCITKFYSVLDYEHLKNWYEQQAEYFNGESSIRDLLLFFDNIHVRPSEYRKNTEAVKEWLVNNGFGDPSCIVSPTSDDVVQNSKAYKSFRRDVVERFNRSIKHKALNDANNIFVYENF